MQAQPVDAVRLRNFANTLNGEMVSFVMSMDAQVPNTRTLRNALLDATVNIEIDISDARCTRLLNHHDESLQHLRANLDELGSLLYTVFQHRLIPAPIYAQFKLLIVQMKFLLPEMSADDTLPKVRSIITHRTHPRRALAR